MLHFEQDIFDKYSDDKIRECLRFVFVIHPFVQLYLKYYIDRHMSRLRVYYKGKSLESLMDVPLMPYKVKDLNTNLSAFVIGMLLPLDKTPLYINVPNDLLQRTIQWRLLQGR